MEHHHPCGNCGHDRTKHLLEAEGETPCSARLIGGHPCTCGAWVTGTRAPDQAGEEFNQAWRPGTIIPGDRRRFDP